jgi:hypothetical protein
LEGNPPAVKLFPLADEQDWQIGSPRATKHVISSLPIMQELTGCKDIFEYYNGEDIQVGRQLPYLV